VELQDLEWEENEITILSIGQNSSPSLKMLSQMRMVIRFIFIEGEVVVLFLFW